MNTRYALITGGSKGLGAHLVTRFWHADYSLVVVARDTTDIYSVFHQLPKRNSQKLYAMPCDLSEPDQISSLIEHVNKTMPYLNVLINNAAIQGPIGPLQSNDFSSWQMTIQVNLLAPSLLCHGLIPLMKKADDPSIINISGGGATKSRPNFSAYSTAKAGLVRFSETIACELESYGIRVNCIAPGAMRTSMLQEVLDNGSRAGDNELTMANQIFVDGGCSMDKAGDLALFLASPYSRGITGRLISSLWDNWSEWPQHIEQLRSTDAYTLRRIVGRDRDLLWADK